MTLVQKSFDNHSVDMSEAIPTIMAEQGDLSVEVKKENASVPHHSGRPVLGGHGSVARPRGNDEQISADTFDKNSEDMTSTVNLYDFTPKVSTTDASVASKITEFLIITRNLFETIRPHDSEYWNESNVDIPLESDELAIEYLSNHNYDVNKAFFHLSVDLGCGKDDYLTGISQSWLQKTGPNSYFIEHRDRISKNDRMKLHGSFRSSEGELPGLITTVDPMRSGGVNANSDDVDANNSNGNSSLPGASRAPRTAERDRQESRKKWQELHSQLCDLQVRKPSTAQSSKSAANINATNSNMNSANSSSVVQASAALDQATQLPPFSTGDDLGESLKSLLCDTVKDVYTSRVWTSEVRDLLFLSRPEFVHMLNSNYGLVSPHSGPGSGPNTAAVLLPEDGTLSFETVIKTLSSFLNDADQLKYNGVDRKGLESLLVELKSLYAETIKIVKRSPHDSSPKPSLAHLWALVRRWSVIPLHLSVSSSLTQLLENSINLVNRSEELFSQASLAKLKKNKSVRKVPFEVAKEIFRGVLECPIELPVLNDLRALVESGEKWLDEVNSLPPVTQPNATAAVTTMSGRRVTKTAAASSGAGAAGNKVTSLQKLESLLNQGESMPFLWPAQLEGLRERLNQAADRLAKLKKSLSTKFMNITNAYTRRKSDGNSDVPTSSDDKLGLHEMKSLLEEGQSLVEESQGSGVRELNRAQSVIAMAEEWLDRVRDMLNHSNPEDASNNLNVPQLINLLEELLQESESLPVALEETAVLRAQVSALSWAQKLRSFVADLQRKARNAARNEAKKRLQQQQHHGQSEEKSDNIKTEDDNDNEVVKSADREVASEEKTNDNMGQSSDAEESHMEVDRDDEDGDNDNDGENDDDIDDIDGDRDVMTDDAYFEQEASKLLRPNDATKYLKEIQKIRSSVSAQLAARFPVKPLVEEKFLADALEQADDVLAKIKKVVHGGSSSSTSSSRRNSSNSSSSSNNSTNISLALLASAYRDILTVPLCLAPEASALTPALRAVTLWCIENRDILKRINGDCRLLRSDSQMLANVEDEVLKSLGDADAVHWEWMSQRSSSSETSNETNTLTLGENNKITFAELTKLVHEANGINVDCELFGELRDLLETVTSWKSQVDEIEGVVEQYKDTKDSNSSRRLSAFNRNPSATNSKDKFFGLISKERVLNLIELATKLDINLEQDIHNLEAMMKTAESWGETAVKKLSDINDHSMSVASKNYFDSVVENVKALPVTTTSRNNISTTTGAIDGPNAWLVTPFKCFQGMQNEVPVSVEIKHDEDDMSENNNNNSNNEDNGASTSKENIADVFNKFSMDYYSSMLALTSKLDNNNLTNKALSLTTLSQSNTGISSEVLSTIFNSLECENQAWRALIDIQGNLSELRSQGMQLAICHAPWITVALADKLSECSAVIRCILLSGRLPQSISDIESFTRGEDSTMNDLDWGDLPLTTLSSMIDTIRLVITSERYLDVKNKVVADSSTNTCSATFFGMCMDSSWFETIALKLLNYLNSSDLISDNEINALIYDEDNNNNNSSNINITNNMTINTNNSSNNTERNSRRKSNKHINTDMIIEDGPRKRTSLLKPTSDRSSTSGAANSGTVNASNSNNNNNSNTAIAKSNRSSKTNFESDEFNSNNNSGNNAMEIDNYNSNSSNMVDNEGKDSSEFPMSSTLQSSTSNSNNAIIQESEYINDLIATVKHLIALLCEFSRQNGESLEEILTHLCSSLLNNLTTQCILFEILKFRVKEHCIWSKLAKKVHRNQRDLLLKYAAIRGLCGSEVKQLRMTADESQLWLTRANAILQGHRDQYMNPDDLKMFLRSGDKLFSNDRNELNRLKSELKKVKTWLSKFQRFTGSSEKTATTSTPSATEVAKLIEEANEIHVDMNEFVEQLQSNLKTYCLCRQPYHGAMIGCDRCEEWYHFSCVQLSKTQADKADQYICIRCALEQALTLSAQQAGQIVNRWMTPDEARRAREARKHKISKRALKDDREVRKLEAQFNELIQSRRRSQPMNVVNNTSNNSNIDDNMNDGINNTNNNIANNNSHSLVHDPESELREKHIAQLRVEVEEARARLLRTQREDAELSRLDKLEDAKFLECQEWMLLIQSLLWPSNDEDARQGRPLGPDNPPGFSLENLIPEYVHYSKSLVPDSIRRSAEIAVEKSIDKIEDVVNVLEHFRWISWCSIALHELRLPMSTKALRRLLDSAKLLRFQDEKIVKQLSGVLSKASAWKIKARKALYAQGSVKMDVGKLSNLVLEANSVPFASRVKDSLRSTYEKLNGGSAPLRHDYADTHGLQGDGDNATSGGGTGSSGGGVEGRRSSKRSVEMTHGNLNEMSVVTITLDCGFTSDEEQRTGRAMARRELAPGPGGVPQTPAAVPKRLWPVNMTFAPVARSPQPIGGGGNRVTSVLSTASVSTTNIGGGSGNANVHSSTSGYPYPVVGLNMNIHATNNSATHHQNQLQQQHLHHNNDGNESSKRSLSTVEELQAQLSKKPKFS